MTEIITKIFIDKIISFLPVDRSGRSKSMYGIRKPFSIVWPCGATAARLTPDQKVTCSNHVEVSCSF